MSAFGRDNGECFACRVMRSFALTGLGAGIGGFGALLLGLERPDAMLWAVVGGLAAAAVLLRRRV